MAAGGASGGTGGGWIGCPGVGRNTGADGLGLGAGGAAGTPADPGREKGRTSPGAGGRAFGTSPMPAVPEGTGGAGPIAGRGVAPDGGATGPTSTPVGGGTSATGGEGGGSVVDSGEGISGVGGTISKLGLGGAGAGEDSPPTGVAAVGPPRSRSDGWPKTAGGSAGTCPGIGPRPPPSEGTGSDAGAGVVGVAGAGSGIAADGLAIPMVAGIG
jgi:hypothetical protein